MNDWMLTAVLAAYGLTLSGAVAYVIWTDKKQRRKKEAASKTAEQVEPNTQILSPENPKVAALRSATRQSLKLNMQHLDALKQMAKVARMGCTDTMTSSNQQDNS